MDLILGIWFYDAVSSPADRGMFALDTYFYDAWPKD
jgi:hypothetical protein